MQTKNNTRFISITGILQYNKRYVNTYRNK